TALSLFQKQNHLRVSGKLDRATLRTLEEQQAAKAKGKTGKAKDVASFAAAPGLAAIQLDATMEQGQRGSSVAEVQRLLNQSGPQRPLKVDGVFGRQTEAAVKRFQREQSLPRTGQVERRTLARLVEAPAKMERVATKREPGWGSDRLTGAETQDVTEYVKQSMGRSLDPKTRERMIDVFGDGLPPVKIHTDRIADEACRMIHAQAFTLKKASGIHIYFKSGKYSPSTQAGYGLLVHELEHAQQAKRGALAAVGRKTERGAAGGLSKNEREALEAEKKAKEAREKAEKIAQERDRDQVGETPKAHAVKSGKGVLQKGHEGPAVKKAQELLNAEGAKPKVALNGKFDASTERAVLSYQREQGLKRTGTIDRTTWARLEAQQLDRGHGAKLAGPGLAPTAVALRSGTDTLVKGHEGSSVRRRQHLLNGAGLRIEVKENGRFDNTTERAVIAFQREQGFARTGTVDRRTWLRLEGQSQDPGRSKVLAGPGTAPRAHDVTTGKAELQKGHEGPAVREVQKALNASGLRVSLDENGKFDDKTERAVQTFQREQGLPRNGKVDRRTFQRLFDQSALASAVATKRSPGTGRGDRLENPEVKQVSKIIKGSRGRKIDPRTRELLEAQTGADLSAVLIHTDRASDQACEAIRSEAFTLRDPKGIHIYFANGRYNPSTDKGRALLAHEIEHAVQAKRGMLPSLQAKTKDGTRVGKPSLEVKAEQAELKAKGFDPEAWKAHETSLQFLERAASETDRLVRQYARAYAGT
ncbi:MAG: peptidoglycan-binding protein, partial [Planctomycetota bacterium]